MYSTGVGFDWGGVLMGPLSEGCFVSVGAWDFVVSWYGQRGLPCMHMVVWAKRISLYAHGGMGGEDFVTCTWWYGQRVNLRTSVKYLYL